MIEQGTVKAAPRRREDELENLLSQSSINANDILDVITRKEHLPSTRNVDYLSLRRCILKLAEYKNLVRDYKERLFFTEEKVFARLAKAFGFGVGFGIAVTGTIVALLC